MFLLQTQKHSLSAVVADTRYINMAKLKSASSGAEDREKANVVV